MYEHACFPAQVRRVACFALMERRLVDGECKKRLEPVLQLSATDLEASLRNVPGSVHRRETMWIRRDPDGFMRGAAEGTMPASKFLEAISDLYDEHQGDPEHLWTRLLVTDSPPAEVGLRPGVPDGEW